MAPAQATGTPVPYPLSQALLEAILVERVSDHFVCELLEPRLGYAPDGAGTWRAGPATNAALWELFPIEPQFIAERPPAAGRDPGERWPRCCSAVDQGNRYAAGRISSGGVAGPILDF